MQVLGMSHAREDLMGNTLDETLLRTCNAEAKQELLWGAQLIKFIFTVNGDAGL